MAQRWIQRRSTTTPGWGHALMALPLTSCKVGTSGWGVRTPCEAVCTLRTSMASQVLLGFRVYKLYYSHFHEQMVLQNCSNFQPSSLPFSKRFARCSCGCEYKKKKKGLQLFWTFFSPANWSESSPCQSDWGCWSIYLSIYHSREVKIEDLTLLLAWRKP